MERIQLLEEKIREAAKTVRRLHEKNVKQAEQYRKLAQENEMLRTENRQTQKIMVELDRLRDERKSLKLKCERLLAQFHKVNL